MKFKPVVVLTQRLLLAILTALNFPLSAAAAATNLPVFPAAKTQPLPPGIHSVVSRCGHTFTMEQSLTADADPHAVANWYQSRLPGSRTIDMSRALSDEEGGGSNSDQTTTIEVFSADGSQTVVVSRMIFSGALAKASKTLGMDKAQIGIESISPPFAPGYIALTAEAAAGGASARSAKQQMKAACKA